MAPNSKLLLDDDQKFALMKFRRSVSDITKPHHDDYFLTRWLLARNWNAEAAEKMLRNSIQWRSVWGIDTDLKTWEAPDALLRYYPSGLSGYDKDGCPVIIVPFIGLDLYGLLHVVTKSDIVRLTIKLLEHYLDLSDKTGARKVTAIIDMDGFHIKDYAWRPAGELIIALIQMYESNYPEILKACYIINAPKVFTLAWSIVKKFLNDYTLSKIHIFKTDQRKWQAAILDRIPVDQLPRHYGGVLVDPDGDPRCPSKIKSGGKVPKNLYIKRNDYENNNQFITSIVKKGEKLQLDYLSVENGCFLKWDFQTEGHDIKFGILCRDEDGNETYVVPPRRVASHQVNEVGVISCQAPATYSVLFDNSYSYMRNKKIHYCIHLTPPINQLNISTLPDDANENSLAADIKN